MDSAWGAAIPTAITALATWYLRTNAKQDKAQVIRDTASDEDMKTVKIKLAAIEAEFAILKNAYFKQNPVTDHRSPK